MNTTRRALLSTAGAATVAVGASGCNMLPTTGGTQILQPVIDAVQKIMATGCGWVPNVATLIAIASMFPGLAGVSTIADTLLKEVSDFLCKQFTGGGGTQAAIESTTAASGLKGTLKDGTGVDLHGYVWDAASKRFVAF